MALSASIHIRGIAELDQILSKLPEEVDRAITAAALQEAGRVILRAAKDNIHNQSGRTVADLRMEVQMMPARHQGAAAIGGTRGPQGRAHILRWLEFGARPHAVKAKRRRDAPRHALRLASGIFRRSIKHPGMASQSPLTQALAEQGDRAIAVFGRSLWDGIVKWSDSQPKVR